MRREAFVVRVGVDGILVGCLVCGRGDGKMLCVEPSNVCQRGTCCMRAGGGYR